MTDRMNNDLAALLTPPPSKGVQFTQGVITSWDREEGHNTVLWRGVTLTDIPFIEGVNPLVIREGDVVGMLGWAPENAKGVGSWWIIGKLTNPGEFVADLTFFLGQVRFLTKTNGYPQVYIGSDTAGVPLTNLYYGDEAGSVALSISGTDAIRITDPSNHLIFENDTQTGVGLARPYLNIPMYPSSGTSVVVGGPFWPAFTNVAYQEVMHGITTLWHPRIRMGVGVSTSGGTVEWQLRLDGVVLASASGSTFVTGDVPGWGVAITPGEQHSVQLYARNTSGAQSRVMTDYCYGLQS